MKRTTKEEQDAKKKAGVVKLWAARIEEAKKKHKEWWAEAKASEEEFIGKTDGYVANTSTTRKERKKDPIWNAAIKTVQPALYSRTPNIVAKPMLIDVNDPVSSLASICLERLGKNLIESMCFDRVAYYARDIYLHSARTSIKTCFEATFTKEKVYVNPTPEQPLDGNTEYFQEQDTGKIYFLQEKLDTTSVFLKPLHYKDVLHNCNARHDEELDWIAYKSILDEDDIEKRFGEELAHKIKYSYADTEEKESKKSDDKFTCVWEIWNKRKKKVYWYCEDYTEDFLDVKDDPYELVGFFPSSPFMLGTVSSETLIPVPDFSLLEPLLNQINGMFSRYRTLVLALKRKGLFDESVPELKALANTADDAEYIGVKNFTKLIAEKGGLDALISHFPTKEFSQAIVELSNAIQDFEQKFYERYGIPDILRGVSDPRETAAAQQQKGRFISLRFSAVQREFQRLLRDSLEQMIDLALKYFPDDKLADLMGFRFFDQEEQQHIPAILEVLRNDTQRQLRVEIETDSTITMNEQAEMEQRHYLAKTLFDGLSTIKGLAMDKPEFMPVIAEAILYTIRGMRNGKQVEGALSAVLDQLKQPPPPPPPPPPDPTIQKAQLDAQIKIQQMQQDSQIKQAELQIKMQQMQLDSLKLERETALKGEALIIEARKLDQAGELDGVKLTMQAQQQGFEQKMAEMQAELDRFQVVSAEKEKYLTELRLQREEARKEQEQLRDTFMANQQPINLTVEAAKPTRKRAKMIKGLDGSMTVETEELGE